MDAIGLATYLVLTFIAYKLCIIIRILEGGYNERISRKRQVRQKD